MHFWDSENYYYYYYYYYYYWGRDSRMKFVLSMVQKDNRFGKKLLHGWNLSCVCLGDGLDFWFSGLEDTPPRPASSWRFSLLFHYLPEGLLQCGMRSFNSSRYEFLVRAWSWGRLQNQLQGRRTWILLCINTAKFRLWNSQNISMSWGVFNKKMWLFACCSSSFPSQLTSSREKKHVKPNLAGETSQSVKLLSWRACAV